MPSLGQAPERPSQESGARTRLSDIETPSVHMRGEARQDEPTAFRDWIKHARFSDFEQPKTHNPNQTFGSTSGKLLGTDDGSSDPDATSTTRQGQGRKPKPDQCLTWDRVKRAGGEIGCFTMVKMEGANEVGRNPNAE